MRKRLALTAAAATAAALTSTAPAQAAPQAAAASGPFYWIVNADTGKALLPYQHSKDSGQPLVQSMEFDGGATHWKIRTTGGGETLLENRHSHLCANALVANGLVRQEYCESPGTKWWVSNIGDMWAGRPVTWRNLYVTGQCMTAFGAATKATACVGASTQQFRLVYVPGT